MRPKHKTQQRYYDRVLLAVYITADDEGLLCTATNAEIARVAHVGVDTAKGYLHSLDFGGEITTFRGGGYHRIMVLMDHPDATATVKRLRRKIGRSDAENRARDEREMRRPLVRAKQPRQEA
jgi:hypothetical protein